MTGKPVFAASEREKVLFPDPAIPVTRTRRPIPKAASLMTVTVPQVLYQAHQLAASNRLRRSVVGTNRARNLRMPEGSRMSPERERLGFLPLSLLALAPLVVGHPVPNAKPDPCVNEADHDERFHQHDQDNHSPSVRRLACPRIRECP